MNLLTNKIYINKKNGLFLVLFDFMRQSKVYRFIQKYGVLED